MEEYIRHGGLPPDYQCDLVKNWTYDEWKEQGEVHVSLGTGTLIYGIVGVLMYIPCLRALLYPDIWSLTAYKILFMICLYQIANLILNSIIAGIFFIMGIVYCNYPNLIYILGSFVMTAWTGLCCGCFLLGFSRLIDLWNPSWHDFLFGGYRIIFSMVFIVAYSMVFLFFCKPAVFNSRLLTWHFDPMVYPDGSHFSLYACAITVLNNEGVVSLSLFMTAVFVLTFLYKSFMYRFKMTTCQKQLFIQTCISSMNNLASATIYVSYAFIEGGIVLNYLGLLTWQISSCGELIMFLFINKTVRDKVLAVFGIRRSVVYTSQGSVSNKHSNHINPHSHP